MTVLPLTVDDWAGTLRHMAAGASIAVVMLLPSGPGVAASMPRPLVSTQRQLVYADDAVPVTAAPDGNVDLRIAFWRTRYGLEHLVGSNDTSPPTSVVIPAVVADDVDLASELRAVSDLPVDTLARLVGVSRVRYHEWLRGAGMNGENVTRLSNLIVLFRTLRMLRGPELRAFLETPTSAGRPLALLEQEDHAAVIGLALRTPAAAPATPTSRRQGDGISARLQPARRLAWNVPRRTGQEREEALERLSPRALQEAEDVVDPDSQDETAVAAAYVLFVE